MKVEFSHKAYLRLEAIADFIYEQSQSKMLTVKYVRNFQSYIVTTLTKFPKAGRSSEEFGEGVRKLVYQRYCILYRLADDHIEILTLYREKLP